MKSYRETEYQGLFGTVNRKQGRKLTERRRRQKPNQYEPNIFYEDHCRTEHVRSPLVSPARLPRCQSSAVQ